jgi:hypothetical protein
MKKYLFLAIVIPLSSLSSYTEVPDKIDLSGEWRVILDTLDVGISEKWYDRDFPDKIHFPGTLCDAGLGEACRLQPAMEKEIFLNLKRRHDYAGVAWYGKTVEIPPNWENKSITLELERVIWNSRLWIDGKEIATENESLSTPHSFDLTETLTPGKHTLRLRIDNRKRYEISVKNMAHAYTNETQTIWNGVIGEMALKAKNKTAIKNLILTPNVENSKVHVKIEIENKGEQNLSGQIIFSVKEKNGKYLPAKEMEWKGNEVDFDYPIENANLWDEFEPNLYEAIAELKVGKMTDTKKSVFGMRKLTNTDALLQINGRRIFLRGMLDCCIFPLKGYPPMDKHSWRKVFKVAGDYGLNHVRFHSWCPPKAAFEAADEMGIYLQVELPLWELNIGSDPKTVDFLFAEAKKIMDCYGNHPSFCFWSLGNELQGDFALLDSMITSLKQKDSRRLYMISTFTFGKGHGTWPESGDDFWVSQWTKKGWVRGQGVFDNEPVCFKKDYSAAVDSIPIPIITHEIGQYSIFPDLKEIKKYTGNLMPLNFIAVKNDLQSKNRLEQADDYLWSSGKFAAILYKEEIERALKTPGFSGFQLLNLYDFPGQGTALVGLLNAFLESKDLIAPQEFRTFCSPIVPLARFDKATWSNDETLEVKVEIANFGSETLAHVVPVWKLTDSNNRQIAAGELPQQQVAIGNALALGTFSVPLSSIRQADCLTLSLALKNTNLRNSWKIWVYPKKLIIDKKDIFYTRRFDEAKKALAEGKKVFLNPCKEDIKGLESRFVPVFWSPVHFPDQPGTMGILCDPKQEAFANFPTEMHSNWQWWDICKNAKTMILDSLSTEMKPLVRMVDNFYKNRNLGLLFEAKSGNGQLLVCSADLNNNLDQRPVAKQLLFSLLNYMQSEYFNPSVQIPFEKIEDCLYKDYEL